MNNCMLGHIYRCQWNMVHNDVLSVKVFLKVIKMYLGIMQGIDKGYISIKINNNTCLFLVIFPEFSWFLFLEVFWAIISGNLLVPIFVPIMSYVILFLLNVSCNGSPVSVSHIVSKWWCTRLSYPSLYFQQSDWSSLLKYLSMAD